MDTNPLSEERPYVVFKNIAGGLRPEGIIDTIFRIEGVAMSRGLAEAIADCIFLALDCIDVDITGFAGFCRVGGQYTLIDSLSNGEMPYRCGAMYRFELESC